MTTKLISLDDVKPLLNIRSTNADYDDRIDAMIAGVTKVIEGACRQTFAKAARTELHTSREAGGMVYDFSGSSQTGQRCTSADQIIPLRSTPVDPDQPVTIWYDLQRQFCDDALLSASCYMLDPDPELARIILNYPTRHGLYALKISYTAGFEVGRDGTLSATLQTDANGLYQAAILTFMHLWHRTNTNLLGSNEASETDKSRYNQVNSYGIPAEAATFLAPYRRVLTGRL